MTNQKRFAHEPPPNPFPLSDIRAQLPDLLDYIKATQHSGFWQLNLGGAEEAQQVA